MEKKHTILSGKQKKKFEKVMHEYGKKMLHSGKGGSIVNKHEQAIAIAFSEAKKLKK